MREKKARTTKPPPARDAALRLLSRREHSTRELQRKLAARGVEESAASEAIAALASRDLQSNVRYAQQLIRTRVSAGYGPRRIRAELEQAGVSRDDIADALQQSGCDWAELARLTLQRRFRASGDSRALSRKRRQFLYARGFESREVDAVLHDCDDDHTL